ncbi:hypothetical protein [Enterococcus faecium]|uniref:hypothetical protein n=1 Tax=Enterococcus faecium TaxID=1352 RepID=UPI00032E1388|nr:hypothetical protein [Enterococcus faecium]EOK66286.1 hypothetical protein SE5_02517 [Enterococcus faecium EnGen0125]
MANFERLAKKYGDQYISADDLQQLLLLVYNCGNADSDINEISWVILYKEMEEFEKIFKYSGTDVPEELQTTSHSLQPFETESELNEHKRNMRNHARRRKT